MKEIVMNTDKLKEEEMTDFTKKVKLLLINSKREILLAYAHTDYQFPGGTQEVGEELIDTINRELKEETGMILNITSIEPFAKSIGYYKDWPSVGRNKKIEIYYYEIITDELPNLDMIELTEDEKRGNFELRYIPLDNVIDELEKNILEYGDSHGIQHEMLKLFEVYDRL